VEVDGEEAHARIIAPIAVGSSADGHDDQMHRTRLLGLLLVVVLGLGLTACGDDGGSDDGGSSDGDSQTSDDSSGDEGSSDTTEAPDTTDGGESAGGVDGYCDAVERYIELLGEAIDDPTSAGAELQEAANDYATAAINLGELTPEEQTQFENCQEAAAEAAAELTGG